MPSIEIKDYNDMIDGKNLFDRPVKTDIRTYNNILETITGQGDGYKTGWLVFYLYFNKHYKKIAIDLSRKQALDADPKAKQ